MEPSRSLAGDFHGQGQKQNIFIMIYTYSICPENVFVNEACCIQLCFYYLFKNKAYHRAYLSL